MTAADDAAIARWLRGRPGWRHDAQRGALVRDYAFADFERAFAFMAAVAIRAQASDHHPEWSNVHRRVTVAWTTHDAGGVSARDLELAAYGDGVAAALGAA
jgi:4a-hydroxytetrahydrobiopterin dehydratase